MWYLRTPQALPRDASHWYWGCLRWSTETFPSTHEGPNLPSCSAGCKSNTGDVENQSTGKGWEPGRPPLRRAQLNPLLVLPSQQLHPQGPLLHGSPATAAPPGDRGTQCGAGGAICVPTESRGSFSPTQPLSPQVTLLFPSLLNSRDSALWAVSLSLEGWVSRDGGRRLWGDQGCNHPKPSSPWMPWPMS